MPTVVTKTLNASGGGDYTSFTAWTAFVGSNLVSTDEQHILECVDTGAYFDMGIDSLDFYGVTTDATRNIIIRAQTGSETNLTKGSGFQFYTTNAYDHLLGGSTPYMVFENLEFVTTASTQTCNLGTTSDMTFTNCYIEGRKTVTGGGSSSTDHTFNNCVFVQNETGWGYASFETYGHTPSDWTFTDCEFTGVSEGGDWAAIFDLTGAYNFTFERCKFHHSTDSTSVVIKNQSNAGFIRFYACEFNGYSNNSSQGINIQNSISALLSVDIFNCNISGFQGGQLLTQDTSSNLTLTVKNTIAVGGGEYNDYGSTGYSANSTNNAGTTSSTPGSNPITIDNDDVYDLGAGDLRLITGSSLLGAGVDLTSTIASDVNGVTYTTPMNIGALQPTTAITATELKYTVKADGTGDYTTLSGALAGAKTATSSNTVTADKYVTIECYHQSSAISDSVNISGWTTGFRNGITVVAALGSETSFTSNSGFGITTSSANVFKCNVDNVTLKNIEIISTSTNLFDFGIHTGNSWPEAGSNFTLDGCFVLSAGAMALRLDSGTYNALVKGCTIKSTHTTGDNFTVRTNAWSNNQRMTIQDCTIESNSTTVSHTTVFLAGTNSSDVRMQRCIVKANAGARGIRLASPCAVTSVVVTGSSTPVASSVGIVRKGGSGGISKVYNAVVSGFATGASNDWIDNQHDVRFRNTVIYNCTTTWNSPTNTNLWDLGGSHNNASDDASTSDILGDNSITGITSSDFNGSASGDYRLASTGSALADVGYDVSGFTKGSLTDVIGVTWTTPYNVGAYEGVFTSGGGTTHNGSASHALVFSMNENATVVGSGTTHSATASHALSFSNDEDCTNANSASSNAVTAFSCTSSATNATTTTASHALSFSNDEDVSTIHSASASHAVITANTEDLGVRHYATSSQTLGFTCTENSSNTVSAISSQSIEFASTSTASNSIPATASSSLTFASTEDITVNNSAVSSNVMVFSNAEDASIVHSASASHDITSSSTEDLGVRHTATSSSVLSFSNDEDLSVVRNTSASTSVVFSINEDASVTQSASSSADTVFSSASTVRTYINITLAQALSFSNEEDASTVHSASASHEVISSNEEDLGVRHNATSSQDLVFSNTDTPSVLRNTTASHAIEFSNTASTLTTLDASVSSDLVFSNTATLTTIVEGTASLDLIFSNDEDCSNYITLSTPIDYVWTDESTWTDWLSWEGLDQLNHSTIAIGDEDASVQHIASSSSEMSFSTTEDCSVQHNATNSSDVIFTNDEDAHVLHKATASHNVITTNDEDAHVLHKATATVSIVFSNRLDEYYVDHQASVNHATIFSNEEDAHVLHKATASHNVITSNVVDVDMLAVLPHNTVVIGEETRMIVIGEETRTISINELL